jgi:GH35 family endo-1,4-beta-xylanase
MRLMPRVTRRRFLKHTAFAGVGAAVAAGPVLSAPSILTKPKVSHPTGAGEVWFRPQYVQRGRGPHLLEWAYASDERWDAFHSNIASTREGVRISDTEGRKKFGVDVRWNVEGFGYLFLTADNGGEFYTLPAQGLTELNLNYELAKSRVVRNRRRAQLHRTGGWIPSRETAGLIDVSEGYLEDATRATGDAVGSLAQTSLTHAIRASEALELEQAKHAIGKRGRRGDFLIGCDARAFFEMDSDRFLDMFSRLFNYSTITYVWAGSQNLEDWEPTEGAKRYGMRDLMFKELRARSIKVEGRPLFWFHKWVTPDWLKAKTFSQLLKYVETTTREVARHYGDGMYAWEIVNELHDWANECRLNHEQTIELTRLACDVAKAEAPKVHRLVNNCCPYAEYVQLKQWSGQAAEFPQRTPVQFTKDLVDAGVDFTLVGQQMYFPYRDLQDIILLLERYEQFGKPVQVSEIGAPGGVTDYSIRLGKSKFPTEPFPWRRHWDEELQADWLEAVFTLSYSKPFIEAANWFDFVDPHSYIENGGLLRSPEGETKASYDRLQRLVDRWKALPERKS